MAIDSSIQGKIAFKNLAGKSQTTDNLELNGEAYGIGFEVQSKDVTIDNIGPTASITIQNGLAIRVRADLYLDPGGNGGPG